MSDLKTGAVDRRRIFHVDPLDACGRRTLPALLNHGVDRVNRSAEHRFHPAVRQVAPSRKARGRARRFASTL